MSLPRKFTCATATGAARGWRRGEGTGFSSEIETCRNHLHVTLASDVARELASHLRLKQARRSIRRLRGHRGEGTGFSSEIETVLASAVPVWKKEWRGNWLLI